MSSSLLALMGEKNWLVLSKLVSTHGSRRVRVMRLQRDSRNPIKMPEAWCCRKQSRLGYRRLDASEEMTALKMKDLVFRKKRWLVERVRALPWVAHISS